MDGRFEGQAGRAARSVLLILALAAAVGSVIVITTLSGRGETACPDRSYGCVEAGGEPLVIGTLFPRDAPGRAGVEALIEEQEEILNLPLEVVSFDGRCSAEAAAHAAREFATEPPQGHAVVGVVGETCPEAEITAARILDDSGIAFVSVRAPSDVPNGLRFYFGWTGAVVGEPPGLSAGDQAAFAATRAISEAVTRVAVRAGGEVLVPRTALRRELLDSGLMPAP